MEIETQKSQSLTLLLWLSLVLAPLVWLWPRLVHSAFGMIDDPSDFTYIESIKNNFSDWWRNSGFHGEPERGRMMPVHWLLRLVFYLLPAGYNPFGWAFIHYINFIVSISAVFWALKLLSGKNFTAVLACLLFIFNRNTIVNYFRLGTQEVTQVLWLSLLFLLAQRLRIARDSKTKTMVWIFISILCFLFYFTKETSVVMFPASLVMALGSIWLKRNQRDGLIFFALNACLFTLQRALSPSITGYASHFQPSIPVIAANLKMYFSELQWHYLYVGLICSYAYRIYESRDRMDKLDLEYWQLFFLLLGSFFVIFLPWTEHVSRHMLVSSYLLCTFSALEIQKILAMTGSGRFLLLGLAALLAYSSPAGMTDTIRDIHARANQKSPVAAIQWLSVHAEKDADVLVLEMEKEPLYSTLQYLQGSFKRRDLTVYPLSEFAKDFSTFNIRLITQLPAGFFDEIDYIFWNRGGAARQNYDAIHQRTMQQISQSKYQNQLKNVDSELFDRHDGYPEGAEIWELSHD